MLYLYTKVIDRGHACNDSNDGPKKPGYFYLWTAFWQKVLYSIQTKFPEQYRYGHKSVRAECALFVDTIVPEKLLFNRACDLFHIPGGNIKCQKVVAFLSSIVIASAHPYSCRSSGSCDALGNTYPAYRQYPGWYQRWWQSSRFRRASELNSDVGLPFVCKSDPPFLLIVLLFSQAR